MVKLQQRPDGGYFITLSKAMIRKKRWDKGKELVASFNENGDILIQEV